MLHAYSTASAPCLLKRDGVWFTSPCDAEPVNLHGNDTWWFDLTRYDVSLLKLTYCRLCMGIDRNGCCHHSFWWWQLVNLCWTVMAWNCSALSLDVLHFTFSSMSSCTEITAKLYVSKLGSMHPWVAVGRRRV